MAYKISDDCTACGTCIDECPVEAISEGDIYKIDPDACTDCGKQDVCPVEPSIQHSKSKIERKSPRQIVVDFSFEQRSN